MGVKRAFCRLTGRRACAVGRCRRAAWYLRKAARRGAADAWAHVPTATLPFGCGMDYNMVYDPGHKVCLLVTGTYGQPTAVWALKVHITGAEKQ